MQNKRIADEKSNILKRLSLDKKDYIVLTLHREENADDKKTLINVLNSLERVTHDLEKSIVFREASNVEFIIEDGENYILVNYFGMLPDLFREGQGGICEGKFDENRVFIANKILAKHDENYMPPEVADALKKTDKWQGEEKKK